MGRSEAARLMHVAMLALVLQAGAFSAAVEASPALVVDASSGAVLYQQDATEPWFPASLTKLMTLYVTLQAVHDHRITLETPLVVSPRAASMPPSKMGFAPGTEVTLDNALKMLMVRSANDLAITVAEGVSGSVEAFADDMNKTAAQLGLHESHFVNPNGLPDPRHVSSARDMAIIGRALYRNFPEHAEFDSLGALALGGEVITNHNNLLGRYPGAEGMKTGFTCPAGFNIVASAVRGSQRVIVVVMGAPTVPLRTQKVSALFDRAFGGVDHAVASLDSLGPSAGASAPDMRDQICKRRSKAMLQFNAEIQQLTGPLLAEAGPVAQPVRPFSFLSSNASQGAPVLTRIDLAPTPNFAPVPVYVGRAAGYIGPVAQARPDHSPVGTEPPPEMASAYAAVPAPDVSKTPFKPDAAALPLKGRHAMKAAAEKPKQKLASKHAGKAAEEAAPVAMKDLKKEPHKEAVHSAKVKEAAAPEKAKPVKLKTAAKSPPKEHAASPSKAKGDGKD